MNENNYDLVLEGSKVTSSDFLEVPKGYDIKNILEELDITQQIIKEYGNNSNIIA